MDAVVRLGKEDLSQSLLEVELSRTVDESLVGFEGKEEVRVTQDVDLSNWVSGGPFSLEGLWKEQVFRGLWGWEISSSVLASQ